MEIITITTPSLGDRSYLVTDGDAAAVIDPQRDIDRVEELLANRGLRLTDVLETHVHNDYVSGGPTGSAASAPPAPPPSATPPRSVGNARTTRR